MWTKKQVVDFFNQKLASLVSGKKDYVIGLDIGSSCVKMAQFQSKADGLHLVRAELKEMDGVDDEQTREKETLSALKYLLRDVDIKRSKTVVAINCPQTSAQKAVTPYMPKFELRQGIMLEAKNYFPFPANDALLDFEILGDVVEKGVRKYEVIVAVSPRETVRHYQLLLKKAGVTPASFVPCPYILRRLAEKYKSAQDQVNFFLTIGRSNSELVALKGDDLVFSRKIPVTGNDFTMALTGVLVSDRGKTELSLEEAEKIKREIGIPSEDDSRIINNKITAMQILFMLRSPLEQLVSEIERCLDYYREKFGGNKIDSIVLLGGGASLGGIIQFLSKELGIEVQLGDVLEGLRIDTVAVPQRDKVSYQSALAIGAALTEGKGINLLPPEVKEKTTRIFKRAVWEVMVVTAVLVLTFLYIGMRIELGNLKKRIAVAQREFSGQQLQLKQVRVYALLADAPYWEDVFKELSNIVPSDIYITRLSMKDKVIAMQGVVVSAEGQERISDFMLGLEKGMFRSVKLISTREIKESKTNEFELKCRID